MSKPSIRRITTKQKLIGWAGLVFTSPIYLYDDAEPLADAWSFTGAWFTLGAITLGIVLLWIGIDWVAERRERQARRHWQDSAAALDDSQPR